MSSLLPPPPPGAAPMSHPSANAESDKTFAITFWLSLVFGIVGADRFYLGKNWTGAIKLLTGGGYGIWWLFDLVTLLRGATLDAKRRPLSGYPASVAAYVIATALLLSLLLGLVIFVVLYGEPVT